MQNTALHLIDKLIACWKDWESNEEYYLTVLAPGIVCSDGSAQLTSNEKKIFTALRRLLSNEEWQQLPSLIAQRRANELNELDSDRERVRIQSEASRQRAEELARQKKEEDARRAAKTALMSRIKESFESDFLTADRVLAADPDAKLVSTDEYDELKTRFVIDWAHKELGQRLDFEQAAATAATGGDILVTARAGSGKTRTLVTRAIFLQKHCRVSPHALLLLAFNRKAAEEMKDRVAQAVSEEPPHVMTFHALAHALVHPEEKLVFDDAPTGQHGLSYEVQEVIDEHLRSKEYGSQIRDLMLAHFREDWEHIVDGRYQLTMDEFLAHRRALPRESLDGHYVKSFGEKVIANALFEHGVDYRYESNYRWNGINYRPDFTIPNGTKVGVVMEYFGLEGDADYDEMSQEKRAFWKAHDGWQLLEYSPSDLAQKGVDAFVDALLRDLRRAGISYKRRSEEEIWRLIRTRALDSFTEAMSNFVGRCRKRNLSPEALELMVESHRACSTAEGLFLEVGISAYRGYLERLAAGEKEDFDGLMCKAVSKVRNRETRFTRDRGRVMSLYSCKNEGGVSTLWWSTDHTALEGQKGYSRHEKDSTK